MNGGDSSHKLNSEITKRQYKAGQVIFREGEVGDVVHLLRQGKVEIRVSDGFDGHRQLALLAPGDIFGEMALFDERRRMATAVAHSDCETIIVSKEEFLRRIGHTDPAIRHLILLLINRLREADQKLAGDQGLERTHWNANQAS